MVTGTAEKLNQATSKVQEKTPASGTGLEKEKGGAETKSERTYRQSEVDALLGKAGQRIQAKLDVVTEERNTIKSQLETLTAEITEARESIASLTKDIEAMSEDDPDKHAVVKLRKEKEAELKAAKAERAKIADAEKEIKTWKRDQLVYSVAADFVTAEGGEVDMDVFKTRADRFNLNGRDELEELAETMGLKLKSEIPTEPIETPSPTPYSGKTEGGSGKSSLKELVKVDAKKLTYPQRLEHKKLLEEAHRKISKS